MISIKKATVNDAKDLAIVGKKAFFIPHQKALPTEVMEAYLKSSFNEKNLIEEISNPNFNLNLIYSNNILIGYSKVIFNKKNEHIKALNVTKMERLYLLKEFYGLGLGHKLFEHNLKLIKQNNQKGIWLYVWVKNFRALEFYKKVGFKKIATYDFPISEKATRLNNVMFLEL